MVGVYTFCTVLCHFVCFSKIGLIALLLSFKYCWIIIAGDDTPCAVLSVFSLKWLTCCWFLVIGLFLFLRSFCLIMLACLKKNSKYDWLKRKVERKVITVVDTAAQSTLKWSSCDFMCWPLMLAEWIYQLHQNSFTIPGITFTFTFKVGILRPLAKALSENLQKYRALSLALNKPMLHIGTLGFNSASAPDFASC